MINIQEITTGDNADCQNPDGISPDQSRRADAVEYAAPDSEPTLVESVYPGARVLFSENFMQVSSNAYPLPWLTREIVQNFVDANPTQPGTLNGVESHVEDLRNGTKRFTISGPWVFQNPTGIIALHSEKTFAPEGISFAGGNGIGVKQTALRFIRDFGVSSFRIVGEGWEVQYDIKKKDETNATLQAAGNTGRVAHDWFAASIRPSSNKGSCHYIVETNHSAVQEELGRIRELGVCDENPHLQNFDFENEFGGLKWLDAGEDPQEPLMQGKLFVNGQLMGYESFSARREVPFPGPGGVTLMLNNVTYQRSLDRPLFNQWAFKSIASDFIASINKENLIEQLRKSKSFWTRNTKGEEACEVIINLIVYRLAYYDSFGKEELQKEFPEETFAYRDRYFLPEEEKILREKKITLCVQPFAEFGIPRASGFLPARLYPNEGLEVSEKLHGLMLSHGVPVDFFHPPEHVQTAEDLGKYFRQILHTDPNLHPIEFGQGAYEIQLPPNTLPTELAMRQFGYPEGSDEKKLIEWIYRLRGAIRRGYLNNVFRSAKIVSPELTMNFFCINDGSLCLKGSEDGTAGQPGLLLEFQEGMADPFLRGFRASPEKNNIPSRAFRRVRQVALGTFVAVAVCLAGYEGVGFMRKKESSSDEGLSLGGIVSSHTGSKSLDDLIRENNQSDIPPDSITRSIKDSLREFLSTLIDEEEDPVENFKTIQASPGQAQQIEILKKYIYLATGGYAIPNPIYVFRGNGTKGLNGGNMIGLHETLFASSLEEALAVLNHECAHNEARAHDSIKFMHANAALFSIQLDTVANIARKSPLSRSPEEQELLGLEGQWERLRTH